MTHFGLICPATTGHLNTMLPLGKELQQRGHRVTLVGILDAQPSTLAAGIEFRAIGKSEFPQGGMTQFFTELGQLSGLAALRHTIAWIRSIATIFLQEAPQAIKEAGIEALLVDQISPEGGSVAEFLGIPFVTVCSAVVLNRDINIPPFNTPWNYSPSTLARLRNRFGYSLLSRAGQPVTEVINEYRRKWNLSPHSNPNDRYSQLAQISQQPAELEFPRENLPKCFHFTGPYHNATTRKPISFPFEKLTGKPLIYASMGTILNRLLPVFKSIAEACNGLDAQLVISLGGSASPEVLPNLPGNPIVVGYAPQLELLQKATLTITHAGLNTTLESLSNGVPIVAIPIINDQPGVAARIVWTGAGEIVPLKRLSVPKLRDAIQKVLIEDGYKQNALRLQAAIQRAGGVSRAADIVEQAVSTRQPVLA
ncbi:glycosyltransferase [Fortiea contorta]|uniref:glycosyltransferase n=1 Tax=Fortiea contorta TaxID=1892405 RepID=UPI00036E11C4|nr:glycosyltransferase [Fortiea contorta]